MLHRLSILLLGLLLLAASPPASSHSAWQQGNDAYRAGDWDTAIKCYQEALTQTEDPGGVAMNLGLVALQRGQWREAEQWFLRASDDDLAPPDRLARAYYHRGVALLSYGGSSRILFAAVQCFEASLQGEHLPGTTQADARHNLEVAKARWLAARDREKAKPPEPPKNKEAQPPEPSPRTAEQPIANRPSMKPLGDRSNTSQPGDANPNESTGNNPGAGSIPIQQDRDPLVTPSPEQARLLLKTVAERLKKDRAMQWQLNAVPERPNVPDW
jgi:tetratricopeptide (TPR) repeat protein